jgi:hypothetical protein
MSLLFATLAVLATATAAPSGSGAGEEPKPGEKRVKVVCRVETPTGTRFSKRVCTPVDQLRRNERDSQEMLREWQSRPLTN